MNCLAKKKYIFLFTVLLSLLLLNSITSAHPPGAADFDEIEKLIDDGWWYDAEARLTVILEANGNDMKAHYYLGRIYMFEISQGIRNHWDEAEKHARKAVELDGTDADNLLLLGDVMGLKAREGKKLAAIGRAKTSKGSVEKVLQIDPDNIKARNWLVSYHMNAPGFVGGDKDEARNQAAEIERIDPVRGKHTWAMIYENVDEDMQKAEEAYKTAIAVDPADPDPYYQYIYFLRRQKRYDDAISVLGKTRELDKGSLRHAFDLGWIYEGAERYDDAVSQYERIAEVDSTRRQAFMRLGFMYQGREMWDEALSSFEKAYQADPDHHYALYQFGRTCVFSESELDRGEEALKSYIDARTSGWWPTRTSALWRLAMIYELKGEKKKAVAALKRGRKLEKSHKETKKLLQKLKR